MTTQKPEEITEKDWTETPATVRSFLAQSIERIAKLEAKIQHSQHRNKGDDALEADSDVGQDRATALVQANIADPTESLSPHRRPRRTLNQLVRLVLALAMAAIGQYLLISGSLGDGLLFFAIAIVLVVIWTIRRSATANPTEPFGGLEEALRLRQGSARILGQVGLIGAILFSVLAYSAFGEKATLAKAWNYYLSSIICLLGGTLLLTQGRSLRNLWPRTSLTRWLLTLIFLLAVVMRLWQLDSLPAGTWYDEAISGLQGVQWNEDASFRPQFESNNPGQLIALFAAALRWFDRGTLAIRLVPAALGIATVLAVYLFGSEIRGPRFGLALAFFVAVARWHVNFSRIAMPGIDTPLFIFLSLFFLTRLLKYGRLRDAVWAGVSLGLGFSIYSAFRLFMLTLGIFTLVGLFVWWRAWWKKLKHGQWWSKLVLRLALLGLASWLTALPVIHFALNKPDAFWDRVQYTSIFRKREESELSKALWTSSRSHLLMFNFAGDRNGRHNLPGRPMLDPAMGVLFLLGLAMALTQWRKPANLFFVMLLPIGLLGGILSLDFEAPQSLRSIAVFPAVVYFCTLALATLGRQAEHDLHPLPTSWLAVPGLLLAGYIVWFNAQIYFRQQAQDFASWNAFSTAESLVGQRMAKLGPDYSFYLSPLFNDHPSIRFLSPETPDWRVLRLPDALPIRRPADKPVVLFIHPDDKWVYETAAHFYPAGKYETVFDEKEEVPVLYIVKLTQNDIALVQGLELRYRLVGHEEAPPQPDDRVGTVSMTWPEQLPLIAALAPDWEGAFVAEWSGILFAPKYGLYQLSLQAPAQASLELDGQTVIALEHGGQQTIPLTLAEGNHQLQVSALSGTGQVNLQWQRPDGQMEIIPQWVLYGPPVTNHGLLGTYYQNDAWGGAPVLARIDPFLNIYFHLTPLPRPYSVEWTGELEAPQPGVYHLGVRAVDWAALYVDEQLVVETKAPNTYTEATITLDAGRHDLRLRFKDTVERSQLHLLWQPPGQQLEAIPSQYLSPSSDSYPEPASTEPIRAERVMIEAQQIPPPSFQPDTSGYRIIIPSGLDKTGLVQPRGIAVGPDGYVYVVDAESRRLLIFDESGALLTQVEGGEAPFEEPSDVAVDDKGQIYVLDAGSGRLSVFAAQGQHVRDVPVEPTYLRHARGLSLDPKGRIWIANTPNNQLIVLDPAGNVLLGYPVMPGLDAQPVDVVVTSEGNIYVTEANQHKLLRLDPNGQQQAIWDIPPATSIAGSHLALDAAGNLYVTLPEAGSVVRLGPEGNIDNVWALRQRGGGQMKPVGIAANPAGEVWVVDSAGGNIVVLPQQ